MSDTRMLKTGVPDTGCRIPGYRIPDTGYSHLKKANTGYRILTLKKGEYRIPDTGYRHLKKVNTGYRIPDTDT